MTTAETVARVRKHLAASRTMQRNLRLRRYEGRNQGGMGYLRHEEDAERLMHDLQPELRGELWAEHTLAYRVSLGRDHGQQRPELRARLAAHRRAIKEMSR